MGNNNVQLANGSSIDTLHSVASKFYLATFDNKDNQNVGLHLKILREYFALKIVSHQLHLPLGLRSLQWNLMTNLALAWYNRVFWWVWSSIPNQFWAEVHQGWLTCWLYHKTYDKSKGLSMVDHCLQFGVLSKSFWLPMPQAELLVAPHCHYEDCIQRVWLTIYKRIGSNAITFFKQMEDTGEQQDYWFLENSKSEPQREVMIFKSTQQSNQLCKKCIMLCVTLLSHH